MLKGSEVEWTLQEHDPGFKAGIPQNGKCSSTGLSSKRRKVAQKGQKWLYLQQTKEIDEWKVWDTNKTW